jgi:pantetheine-phosphate adenylyltransferase
VTDRILLPGSYDPVTVGHLAVIERAAKMAQTVYVAIFVNPDKSYTFSLEDRLAFLRAACRHLPNVRVVSDSGMVIDFVRRMEISLIIKGVRNESDFLYEREMADFNRRGAGVETLLLPCEPALREVSSSELRRRLSSGEPIAELLPKGVAELVKKAYGAGARS